jgi:hypothetical protein
MTDPNDPFDDIDILRAFAEKNESLFMEFVFEYKQDQELEAADQENDLRKCEEP